MTTKPPDVAYGYTRTYRVNCLERDCSWVTPAPTARPLFREARAHVKQTGHRVIVLENQRWEYRRWEEVAR